MAFLPDLTAAVLYGVVVFVLALGFLLVFVETVPSRRLAAVLIGAIVVAAGLAGVGEPGMSLLVVGFAAALIANHALERLTTR